MKLPFKHIAILVLVSLIGIFAYQAYWLTGLYHTMKDDLEHSIVESMRMSDYNEMMLRVENLRNYGDAHGEVSVAAGYNDEGKSFVRSSTTTYQNASQLNSAKLEKLTSQSDSNITYLKDSTKVVEIYVHNDSTRSPKDSNKKAGMLFNGEIVDTPDDSIKESKNAQMADQKEGEAALTSNSGLDIILKDKNSMLELATHFQRGLHSGLDLLMDPDLHVYDSLLTLSLRANNIFLPHRTEFLHSGSNIDSTLTFTDTLGIAGDSSYIPGPKAQCYNYAFDLHSSFMYRLWIEPVTLLVLKQMIGILITSFIIFIILSFSFWYLIRTILRQKSFEEITSDFTNNITHELKTPISVAYAANDALLNFNQAEEKVKRDKYLRICQEQLQRLSGLVEQILSMSMERRKTFRLHTERLELKPMLDTLIELHKLKAEKEITITYEIEPANLSVMADRTHFSNIISNLIDNAVKYSPGQVLIKLHCHRNANGQVEISVTDQGIGIASEKQKHIFDKFYRVPTGNLHDVKGYGLGLYYVRTMIEKHGGTVSVESEPGHGSIFTLVINE